MAATSNPFAQCSNLYATARPPYPPELFAWLAQHSPARDAAWDGATGTGQAAMGLADHFTRIEATDVSAEQLAEAPFHPNIRYSQQPSEATDFAPESFDLVVTAQALHWFQHRDYWREVTRVSRPGALFAAWGYSWFEASEELEHLLLAPYQQLLLPFWAPQNRLLWEGYPLEAILFPFQPLDAPDFTIELHWTLPQLLHYLQTWSAYRNSRVDRAVSTEIERLFATATQSFGETERLSLRLPLRLIAGLVR